MSETNPPLWDPDAIDWDEVVALRRMSPMEKITRALGLQRMAREFCLMGIRRQHPSATPEEVTRMLDERMARGRPWG